MFSAPSTVSWIGNPIDSELSAPPCTASAAHCGQRTSSDMSGTDTTAAFAASRHGPCSYSYCSSSSRNAISPLNAAVCAPSCFSNVTDTSSAPGIVRRASSETWLNTPDRSVSPNLIWPSSEIARIGINGLLCHDVKVLRARGAYQLQEGDGSARGDGAPRTRGAAQAANRARRPLLDADWPTQQASAAATTIRRRSERFATRSRIGSSARAGTAGAVPSRRQRAGHAR